MPFKIIRVRCPNLSEIKSTQVFMAIFAVKNWWIVVSVQVYVKFYLQYLLIFLPINYSVNYL